jgi:hypothetical protein
MPEMRHVQAALRALYGNESDGMLSRYQGSVLNDWRLTDAVAEAIAEAERTAEKTCRWTYRREDREDGEMAWHGQCGYILGGDFFAGEQDELDNYCENCGGRVNSA